MSFIHKGEIKKLIMHKMPSIITGNDIIVKLFSSIKRIVEIRKIGKTNNKKCKKLNPSKPPSLVRFFGTLLKLAINKVI